MRDLATIEAADRAWKAYESMLQRQDMTKARLEGAWAMVDGTDTPLTLTSGMWRVIDRYTRAITRQGHAAYRLWKAYERVWRTVADNVPSPFDVVATGHYDAQTDTLTLHP